MPLHPLQEQRDSVRDWRQIGLGIMGLSDALIKMEISYGGEDAIHFCEELSTLMADNAMYASAILACDQGAYPKYQSNTVHTEYYRAHVSKTTDDLVKHYGLRNSQLLTIAPTGTLSTMLGISGGIEPIFANSYTRKTESLHGKDVYYKVYTPIVDQYMKEHNITDENDLPAWFVTSADIDPIKRVKMQAAWQQGIDASISSTVNLPNSATVDNVKDIYMTAWKAGLKGITVFRDGCKRAGVLTTSDVAKPQNTESVQLQRGDIIECSDDLIGKKRKLTTGCGSLHVLGFFDPVTGELQECYLNKGSTGGCANFMTGLSRTISLLCRAGVSVYDIKDQLDSTGSCPSYASRTTTQHDTSKGACCPMAVGNALIDMYEEMQEEINDDWENLAEEVVHLNEDSNVVQKDVDSAQSKCPECGAALRHEGGCDICPSCGWSHCG